VKKINKRNKLLINQETVRNMSEEQLRATEGGTLYVYTESANSAGPSLPGPSRSDSAYIGYNVYVY
jgi:hypothetical protein